MAKALCEHGPPASFFMWPLEVLNGDLKKGKWGLPSASLKNELP